MMLITRIDVGLYTPTQSKPPNALHQGRGASDLQTHLTSSVFKSFTQYSSTLTDFYIRLQVPTENV